NAGEGRSGGHRPRAAAEQGDDAQHPAEPVLLVRVQRRRHPAGGRRALSFVRIAAEPDGGGRGDGDELGRGDWQLAAPAGREAVAPGRLPARPREPKRGAVTPAFRPFLWLLLAAALFARAFVPQGYMPERTAESTLAVAICGSSAHWTI